LFKLEEDGRRKEPHKEGLKRGKLGLGDGYDPIFAHVLQDFDRRILDDLWLELEKDCCEDEFRHSS